MKDNVKADAVGALLTIKYLKQSGMLLANHDPETGEPLEEDLEYAATRALIFGSNLINNTLRLDDQEIFQVFVAGYEIIDAIIVRAASEQFNINNGNIELADDETSLWEIIKTYVTGRDEDSPDKVSYFSLADFDKLMEMFTATFEKILENRKEE